MSSASLSPRLLNEIDVDDEIVVVDVDQRSLCVSAPPSTAPRGAPQRPPPAQQHPGHITTLISTLGTAQGRKRQRDQEEREAYEATCNMRHVGVQTNPDGWEAAAGSATSNASVNNVAVAVTVNEDDDEEDDAAVQESGISATKRIRLDLDPNPRKQFDDVSTLTDESAFTPPEAVPAEQQHDPVQFPAMFVPTEAEPRILRGIDVCPDQPNEQQQPAEVAARRIIRRAARSRRHQHTIPQGVTLYTDPQVYLQQVHGIVPSTEHTCDARCSHNSRQAPSATTTSTAAAAAAPNPLSSASTIPYTGYPRGFALQAPVPRNPMLLQQQQLQYQMMPTQPAQPQPLLPYVPMMGVVVQVPVPINPAAIIAPAVMGGGPPQTQPTYQNVYAFRPPPGNYPVQETVINVYRPNAMDYLFPAMDRYGLERLHMFAGLDIDVPVGASRADIDRCTVTSAYKKPDEEEEEATCTVCLSGYDDGENIRRLSCNHFFHPECIDKWLDINKKCPMCREEIDRKTTEPAAPIPVVQ